MVFTLRLDQYHSGIAKYGRLGRKSGNIRFGRGIERLAPTTKKFFLNPILKKGQSMKKLAVTLMLICMLLFGATTVSTLVGCGDSGYSGGAQEGDEEDAPDDIDEDHSDDGPDTGEGGEEPAE